MITPVQKRWKTMLKKYGSEEEVRRIFGSGGKIGGLAKGEKGLASPKISPEKKAEIIRKGVEARKAKV